MRVMVTDLQVLIHHHPYPRHIHALCVLDVITDGKLMVEKVNIDCNIAISEWINIKYFFRCHGQVNSPRLMIDWFFFFIILDISNNCFNFLNNNLRIVSFVFFDDLFFQKFQNLADYSGCNETVRHLFFFLLIFSDGDCCKSRQRVRISQTILSIKKRFSGSHQPPTGCYGIRVWV